MPHRPNRHAAAFGKFLDLQHEKPRPTIMDRDATYGSRGSALLTRCQRQADQRRDDSAVRCRMPLTSEQAVAVVRELLVPAYVNEHPLTKGVIASIPEGKADFAP